MDVHPTKNGINRYWSIPIYNHKKKHLTTHNGGCCSARQPIASPNLLADLAVHVNIAWLAKAGKGWRQAVVSGANINWSSFNWLMVLVTIYNSSNYGY